MVVVERLGEVVGGGETGGGGGVYVFRALNFC